MFRFSQASFAQYFSSAFQPATGEVPCPINSHIVKWPIGGFLNILNMCQIRKWGNLEIESTRTGHFKFEAPTCFANRKFISPRFRTVRALKYKRTKVNLLCKDQYCHNLTNEDLIKESFFTQMKEKDEKLATLLK